MCSLLDWFGQQFELTARLVDFVEESPEIAFFICKSVISGLSVLIVNWNAPLGPPCEGDAMCQCEFVWILQRQCEGNMRCVNLGTNYDITDGLDLK